ncbi:MAG: hypothetical protein PUH84_05015 [Firmicutes bacterium]|nr:hypothetical protein [Acholeplasma sp.]MDD7132458.1 hypothetical protein [Bacillota bacterium]
MNNKDSYFRELKIPFNAIHFLKKDIVTRSGTPLNFYQKNILLILTSGISAKDIEELSNKLSTMLNIKYSVIKEYIEYLYKMKAITFSNNKFMISEDLNYTYSDKHQDVMIANTKMGKDVLSYVYLLEIGSLLSQKILDDNNITSTEKNSASNYTEEWLEKLYQRLEKLSDNSVPLNLAKQSLSNAVCDDCRIKKEDLQELFKSKVNLPFKIEYVYNRETGVGEFRDCFLNIDENNIIHEFLQNKNYKLKISTEFKEDSKKPDFILYEEAINKEKEERIELQNAKLKSQKIAKEKADTQEQKAKVETKLEEQQEKIKSLNKQLKELKEDNKEYQRLLKEISNEEAQKNSNAEKLKELNKQENSLNAESSKNDKEVKEITKSIIESHEKLYVDAFEKKLSSFEKYNNKLYGVFPNVFNENYRLINTLLSMSKKINDSSPMVEEWFNLYYCFTCYLKFLLSMMLNRKAETIDSFKSELINDGMVGTNNRMNLTTKYNINGQICDDLIMIEISGDHIRHLFDSIQHSSNYQKSNPNSSTKQKEVYKEFLNNNKEKKKEILYSLVQLFERANLDNESMKLLEDMIIDNYKKTTN